MTEEQKEFESKYHLKYVVPKIKGNLLDIKYLITAALYHHDDNQTILALYRLDGKDGNLPNTLKMNDRELEDFLQYIEIIGELSEQERLDYNQMIDNILSNYK